MYVCNVSQPQRLEFQLKLLFLPAFLLLLPLESRNLGQLLDAMLVNSADVRHKKPVIDLIPANGGKLPSHFPQ